MTTKQYDWTKLTNGWVRGTACIVRSIIKGLQVYVYDDGRVAFDYVATTEEALELLTEAIAQRKQCEVREPRFKFGDWVKTPLGSRHRVVDVRRGGVCYTLPLGGISLYAYDESELTPCDPPGDGGVE